MSEDIIVPSDIRSMWENASQEVRAQLAREQFAYENKQNACRLNQFLTVERENLGIPQYNLSDFRDRLGFGSASIQHAIANKNQCTDRVTVHYANVLRDSDGDLVTGSFDEDGILNMNTLNMTVETAQIVQRIIQRTIVSIESGITVTNRDLVYELIDEFKIPHEYANNKLKDCKMKAAQVLGVPINLLPFENGHSNEYIFGRFDLCFGDDIVQSCHEGNWPIGNLHEMSKWMYGLYDNDDEAKQWTIRGDFSKVSRMVTFKKVSLARTFWDQLDEDKKR